MARLDAFDGGAKGMARVRDERRTKSIRRFRQSADDVAF